ncbi:MAG TPA: serine/threonine-protein kinase [Thermoanaerobaculia bacterium]|jgi:serine/threonine-protein kinase|nr:serine/threonine-protein kinase [Thermoanaerobaculia bacterium]
MAFFCIHCRSEIDPAFKACPFCGEPVTDFLRRYLEQPLDGKYQVLAQLGVGGMGEVYKVLHLHLNAVRVIKLMRSAIAGEAGAHERFLREARLATKIQHPNVAALFDFSTLDDGSRYMVWEFIEGTNLHELIESRGPLAPRYAATLAIQALRGLDAIHRAGIVHRDVSPENLMIAQVDRDERVKIIDLGIAKGSDATEEKTKTGMFVGKWKYCSPEHLGMLEAGDRIDGRADIYSFGIVLYEMLAGVPPFQADTPHSYLMMHASERPKPMREINPTVPDAPELEALIFRALEKDRGRRFRTAREFADELERILPTLPETGGAAQIPVATEVTDEVTRLSAPEVETVLTKPLVTIPSPPEPKRSPAAAIIVVFALLVAGAFALFSRHREEPIALKPKPLVAAAVVPITRGRVAINAFPWGEITAVKNVETGQSIDIGPNLFTPAPLELAPGRYEITLRNPQFPTAITKKVEVTSERDAALDIQFRDPASAPLPDFGASQ